MNSIEIEEQSSSGNEWVLDSLVGFLKGPLWSQPLFSFLDEKSVGELRQLLLLAAVPSPRLCCHSPSVFDPEDDGSNDKEYEIVFKEYNDWIGKLLESHMEELQISTSQFEKACEEAEGVLSRKFHQTLFEQIWAANDFTSFKRMMIQINIDLQLWALEILASKYGRVPDAFLPEGASADDFLTGDDFFLREAKRRSMHDVDDVIDSVSRQLTRVTVSVERPPPGVTNDHEKDESQSHGEKLPHNDENVVTSDDPFSEESGTQVPAVTAIKLEKGSREGAVTLDEEVVKTPASFHRLPDENLNAEEIKHRQDYLRRQRDKLLGLKKEEREKQAARLDRLEKSGRRPRTAKFIAIEDSKDGGNQNKTRAYMRSLAARIKAEVMGMSVCTQVIASNLNLFVL